MKTSQDIRQQTADRINRMRRVLRILDTDDFTEAWDSTNSEESKRVEDLIISSQATQLELWLKSKKKRNYEEMSIRELREIAKNSGIPYYGSLSKSLLLWELENANGRTVQVANGSNG